MATFRPGHISWSMTRDAEGHRTYKIAHLVKATISPRASMEGPASVLQASGLPQPGDYWLVDGDVDVWAWCRADADVKVHEGKTGEPAEWWVVEQTFSTKPLDPDQMRCQDDQIGNPLLEPQRISGSFVKYTEEATVDRYGSPIQNSAWEQIRGPTVEFDKNRPQIVIEQNVADLELDLLGAMTDCVNDAPLWGFPKRCIKLSQAPWERKFYGTCSVYYTRRLTFDIMYETFDRDLLDEGTKVLYGHWGEASRGESDGWVTDPIPGGGAVNPNYLNPHHFIRAKDRNGENIRVVLNGAGVPISAPPSTGTGTGTGVWVPGSIHVEKYSEANLLLLNIPTSF